MNGKELLNKRRERVALTLDNKKADKVPYIMWRSDYLVNYYNTPMSKITSYDMMFDIFKRANEELEIDVCDPAAPINLFHKGRFDVMGGGVCVVMPGGDYIQINAGKLEIMMPDDYDEVVKDPIGTFANKILPRRLDLLAEGTCEEKLERYHKLDALKRERGAFAKRCEEELGMVASSYANMLMPVDYLFDYLRDFEGIIADIRRRPSKVLEFAEMMTEFSMKTVDACKPLPYSTIGSTLHLPSYIKPKDFEKIYWPSFSKLSNYAAEKGHKLKYIFEKEWKHLFDFLEQLPENAVMGFFERDEDFRYLKKRFGKRMILAGGVDTNLLVHGTKEENIASIKSVIDDCCADGGVFLAADMPILYPNDAKPENLKAVIDTIADYGKF